MPDPSAHPADLLCPLCTYDLRGLPDPRCPECGHAFEWADLTDPARRQLRWLVEHRFRLGPVFTTSASALAARRFWQTLRPSHRLGARRAIAFWLLGPISILAFYFAFWTGVGSLSALLFYELNTMVGDKSGGVVLLESRWEYLAWVFPDFLFSHRFLAPGLFVCVGILAVPAAAGIILGVMWQSFAKVRILRTHAVRVWAYSTDVLPLAFVALVGGIAVVLPPMLEGKDPTDNMGADAVSYWYMIMVFATLGYSIWSAFRLEAAVRLYLGVRRAWSVALAAFIMQGCLWVTVMVTLNNLGLLH